MYLLGVRANQEPGQLVFSDVVVVENTGVFGDTLSINIGLLLVNGVPMGQSAVVFADDTVQVRLNSPNDAGQSAAVIVKQEGQVVGYFVVITRNVFGFTYDERYNDLFSFEAVPEESWVPDNTRLLHAYNTNGDLIDSYNLTTLGTGNGVNTLLSLDYQRDRVYVFDTGSKQTTRILTGGGPVAELTLYDDDHIKSGNVIAYNKDGKIRFYSPSYDVIAEIDFPNVGYIGYFNNKLYAAAKHGTVLHTWDINRSSLAVSNPITQVFPFDITFLVHNGLQMLVLAGDGCYDTSASLLTGINAPARSACLQPGTNRVYVTHGAENFITVITDNFGSPRITITGAIFLDTIEVQAGGRCYVNDIENKKVYVREVNNQDWETGVPGFGVALSDYIYVLDIYNNIPSKVRSDDGTVVIDSTAFQDIEGVIPGDAVTTGNLHVVGTGRPLNTRFLPYEDYCTLLKNGQPVADVTTVTQGDTLSVSFDYEPSLANPTVFAVVIDQEVYDVVVYGDTERIIPTEFVFNPRNGVSPSTFILSNTITVHGLDRPVSITAIDAEIIINGSPVTQPFTLNNGDDIQLRVLSDASACGVVVGQLNIEDRFLVPFSVSTFVAGSAVLPDMDFGQTFDLPLGRFVESDVLVPNNFYTALEWTIPDLYDATFIRNGVDVGRTVTLSRGHSIKIRLRTSYNYDTPHHVTMQSCYGEFSWIAWTVGDSTPDPFDFGIILDLSIKDKVLSDVVALSGIGTNVNLNIKFPYGTYPIINGVRASVPPSLLDYRGMLLKDHRMYVRMSNGSTLQLEGYPRPTHGDINELSVTIGGRRGDWTLGTYVVLDPVPEASYLTGIENFTSFQSLDFVTRESSIAIAANNQFIQSASNKSILASNTKTATVASSYVTAVKPSAAIKTTSSLVSSESMTAVHAETGLNLSERNNIYVVSGAPYLYTNFTYTYSMLGNNHNLADYYAALDLQVASNSFVTAPREVDYKKFSDSVHYLEHLQNTDVWTSSFYTAYIDAPEQVTNTVVFSGYEFRTAGFEYIVSTVSYYAVKMLYQKESIQFITSDAVKFVPAYIASEQGPRVQYAPEYVFSNNKNFVEYVPAYIYHDAPSQVVYDPAYVFYMSPAQTVYDPVYEKTSQPPTAVFSMEAKVSASLKTAYVDLSLTTTFNSNLFISDYGDTQAFSGTNQKYADARPTIFGTNGSYITSDVREVQPTDNESSIVLGSPTIEPTVFEDHDLPYDGQQYPGYFSSHAEAVADAYSWGAENGTFYTIQVPDRGWAWTLVIECANMCNPNDCPPSGYIQGG